MASKRRSRAVEIRANYPTRRAKSSRQAKKVEDKKLISEQNKAKNVIREIEKPKSHTGKKPQEQRTSVASKQFKQKKNLNRTQARNLKSREIGC